MEPSYRKLFYRLDMLFRMAGTLSSEQKREVSGACPECSGIGLNPVRGGWGWGVSPLAAPFLPNSLNCSSAGVQFFLPVTAFGRPRLCQPRRGRNQSFKKNAGS